MQGRNFASSSRHAPRVSVEIMSYHSGSEQHPGLQQSEAAFLPTTITEATSSSAPGMQRAIVSRLSGIGSIRMSAKPVSVISVPRPGCSNYGQNRICRGATRLLRP